MVVGAAFVCAVASHAQQAAAPAPPRRTAPPPATVRPVATMKQLMTEMIKPASDAVFKAASEAPSTAAAWTELHGQALALAEEGNLLMIGNRPPDRGEWMRMSRAMIDAAASAVKAIDAKNADALSMAGDQIYETCESCHAKYMKR
jgi:hypothetical protein